MLKPIVRSVCAAASSCLLVAQLGAAEVEIMNIRVGQGDATLIRGPEDATGKRITVLIDAADMPSRPGGKILKAVLAKRNVTEIDHVIVTHYDADHISGLVEGGAHGESFLLGWDRVPGSVGDDDGDGDIDWVSGFFFHPDPEELGTGDDIRVGQFIDRGTASAPTTQAYRKYEGMAEAHGNRLSLDTQAEVDSFEIDLGGGAVLTCVAGNGWVRDRLQKVANVNTENERSLTFHLSFDDFDYLIGGDLIGQSHGSENAKVELAVGQYLAAEGVKVEVLHVNHHGANNGSEEEFLNLIRPHIAVISAGNGNDHKHPHRKALQRLVDAGVYRIIQTSWGSTTGGMPDDIRAHQAIYQNDVIVTTNGVDYTISTSRTYESE